MKPRRFRGVLVPFEPTILVFLALVVLAVSTGGRREGPGTETGLTHVAADSLDCIREEEALARALYLFLYGERDAAGPPARWPVRGAADLFATTYLPGTVAVMLPHSNPEVNCSADTGPGGRNCPVCPPSAARLFASTGDSFPGMVRVRADQPGTGEEMEIARKHLRAYVNALLVQGFDYQPRFISRELFASVVEP